MRVTSVAAYPTFAAMINDVGVKYHAFANQRGTYGALEAAYGAVRPYTTYELTMELTA